MDITRSSLLPTMLYTALLLLLFWIGGGNTHTFTPIDTSIFGQPWDMVTPVIGNNASTERVIAAITMFIISFQVARLAIRNVIYLERTYMPSMIFVIVSAAFYSTKYSLAPLLATFFFVLAFSQGLRSYPVKTIASRRILTAGFFLGTAAFIYPPAIYFAPLIYVMLSMFRVDKLKEWIVGTVGVGLPFGIYFFTLWVMQRNVGFAWEQFYRAITLNDMTIEPLLSNPLNIVQYTFVGVLVVLFVLSIIRFLRNAKAYKRRSALGFGFFVIATVWTICVMFFSPVRSLFMLPILGLGLSIVIPTYFAANRPTFWTNFLYALLLFSSIAIHLI